jgi:hypothetical protein
MTTTTKHKSQSYFEALLKTMSIEARKPLLERNITRTRPDVSLAAFAFLFSEMVQNAHARVSRVDDLEAR